ncbi:60S ribosomal protein L7a-2 [Glycine soja]
MNPLPPGTPPRHLCHNFPHQESPQKPDSGGGDINEGSSGVSVLRDDEVDEGGGFDAQASNFQGRALRSLLWQLNSLMFSVSACDGIGEVIDMTTPRAFPPKRDLTRFVKWPKNVQIQRNKRILKQRLKVPLALNQFTTTLDKNLVNLDCSLCLALSNDKVARPKYTVF